MTCRLPTKSGDFQPARTIFLSMEQQTPSVQLDTTVLLMCLASPSTSIRSVVSQSVPDSDKPCPLWLHPRVCAASWSCELGQAACTPALSPAAAP